MAAMMPLLKTVIMHISVNAVQFCDSVGTLLLSQNFTAHEMT